jgi:hypothetical protein
VGVVAKGSQAVMVQQGPVVVALLDLDDPGRIANHSMAVAVVLVAPAVVGVVVALHYPMFRSIY